MQNQIKVSIFEDQRIVRETLAGMLASEGLQVVGSAGRFDDFLSLAQTTPPDVAVIDLRIEGPEGQDSEEGWKAIAELRRWHPDVRVLVLSASRDPADVERCYQAGAAGYIDKNTASGEAVIGAVKAVANGERMFPLELKASHFAPHPAPPAEMSVPLASLTHREREVLRYVASGDDNLKIAAMLSISERTVRAHVSNLYRKLGPENRAQLALLARRLGVRPASEA